MRSRSAFSLLELSIVVVIVSIVATAGLEVTANFIGKRSLSQTREKVAKVDLALAKFYKTFKRLPCPSPRVSYTSSGHGSESCTVISHNGGTILPGVVPYVALNLQRSDVTDAYGNLLLYAVTTAHTSGAFATTPGAIEVRSGRLVQPCGSGNCTTLTTQASYFLFSTGPDARGGFSRLGLDQQACDSLNHIDSQNCGAVTGEDHFGMGYHVFYDSRYNAGIVTANYFDDVVAWRTRGTIQ